MNSKLIGATSIIAGTAIGGGMLGIPIATASIGIVPAFLLIIGTWVVSAYSALLMMELNLKSGINDNVHVITGKTLGKVGQFIQGFSFLWLLVALTTAYLSGGSRILIGMDIYNDSFSGKALGVITFSFILGVLTFLGIKVIDKVASILFIAMIITLIIVIGILLPEVNIKALTESIPQDNMLSKWGIAIPVLFTSFGFHVCIATIVKYLDGNSANLRKVILIGSSIPAICYLIWVLVTLGFIGSNEVMQALQANNNIEIKTLLQANLSATWYGSLIAIFSQLALVTSFIGVSLSLFEFLKEVIKAKDSTKDRVIVTLITFVPPVILAIYAPNFLSVLSIASIPLVIMIIFLPILMAKVMRKGKYIENEKYRVYGGDIALAALGSVGVIIVVSAFYAGFFA